MKPLSVLRFLLVMSYCMFLNSLGFDVFHRQFWIGVAIMGAYGLICSMEQREHMLEILKEYRDNRRKINE